MQKKQPNNHAVCVCVSPGDTPRCPSSTNSGRDPKFEVMDNPPTPAPQKGGGFCEWSVVSLGGVVCGEGVLVL